jgi:hypothetical protein
VLAGAAVLAGWAVGLAVVAAPPQAVATNNKTDTRLKNAFLTIDLLLLTTRVT